MAPEQILNSEVDGRADIYATATMLYEMLTPEPLFSDIQLDPRPSYKEDKSKRTDCLPKSLLR